MKEPTKIPLDPTAPRTQKPKSYRLNSIDEQSTEDVYYPDNDSVYTPIIHKIHEDFYIETLDQNINKLYENIEKGTET